MEDHTSWIQWGVEASWGAGLIVAGFLWRLSVKVNVMEAILQSRLQQFDTDTERRHSENLHTLRGVQMQLNSLAERIDKVKDRAP